MKKISLNELNANGQLMVECRQVAFIRGAERMPLLYKKGDPSVCYVHYYKNAYIVTQHIVSDLQLEFHELDDAYKMFQNFVDAVRY